MEDDRPPAAPVERDRWQFIRFLVVGVINTGFSYGIYVLLVWFGLNFALANLIALVLGIIFSFTTQGRFVFKETDNRRIWRFVLVWSVIYGVNTLLIGALLRIGINAYIGGALALPVNTALSYIAQKYFVFRRASATSS